MRAAADFALEKNELEAVLASGIFTRAPNLAHVLIYVCEKYFEGSAEQIKEYNIAVEALGRAPEFDQKRDSIVRVEAHRLRKRLREYYEADGRSHAVRIEIPSGQYAPKFIPQHRVKDELATLSIVAAEPMVAPVPAAETQEVATLPLPAPSSPEQQVAVRVPNRRAVYLTLATVTFCATAAMIWRAPARTTMPSVGPSAPAAAGAGTEVRILAGLENGSYTDRSGHVWESDRYFTGGGVFDSGNRPIFGTRDLRLFQTRREGTFSYDIPLPPGIYEMRLYFAETLYGEGNMAGGETSRIFTVLANGVEILHQFDIIGEVGASAADTRAFKDLSPAADGKLHLKFEAVTNSALITGIEITPGLPGRLLPIRMVSRDHQYTDRQGRTWESDRYSFGGQLVRRTEPIASTDDPDLLRGERYGNLRYAIPVPPGRYSVTLYFVETWFGPGKFASGGVGSRLFDILCNGVAVRRSFDIFKESRGSDRAVTFTLRGLEPDAQGKINISLVPLRNYASLNALEVLDESK